jgi:PAS domain S-box-containing protein
MPDPDMAAQLILVVDDDRDTRELYHLVFELAGYRVAGAGSVADALHVADQLRPDVILTDWLLGDGDGFALCRSLHRRGRTRHIPIVAVTGVTLTPADIQRARDVGCGVVLTKPVDVDHLVAVAGTALHAATARRLRAAVVRVRRRAGRLAQETQVTSRAAGDLRSAARLLVERRASAREPVALIIADDSGKYVAANSDAAELTGYDPQELATLSVWDLTPGQASDLQQLWRQFIEAGTQEGAVDLRRRDGRVIQTRYVAIANVAPGLHVGALSAAPRRRTFPTSSLPGR